MTEALLVPIEQRQEEVEWVCSLEGLEPEDTPAGQPTWDGRHDASTSRWHGPQMWCRNGTT